MRKNQLFEKFVHGIFLILGLLTIACVLLISIYLIISGIPAIREIGLFDFLLGDVWASTADEAQFGILPFILTSIYGYDVVSLNYTFSDCKYILISPSIPKTIKLMEYTFRDCKCLLLKPEIPDSVGDTKKVFYGCIKLFQ